MLGIWERNCSSVVIIFIVGGAVRGVIRVGEFDLLCVLMFIEGRKLNEWNINCYILPSVELDKYAMNGEKQVVIRLLESLCDCVQLALVRAGVIGLRFAGD